MPTLTCIDRSGRTGEFTYSVAKSMSDASGTEWTYRARPIDGDPFGEFFELTVTELSEDAVRVVMMANNDYAPVSAKGIPDALIPQVAAELGRQVQSSPTTGRTADVRRSEDATKVWKRLVKENIARYDESSDIYFTVPPEAKCST